MLQYGTGLLDTCIQAIVVVLILSTGCRSRSAIMMSPSRPDPVVINDSVDWISPLSWGMTFEEFKAKNPVIRTGHSEMRTPSELCGSYSVVLANGAKVRALFSKVIGGRLVAIRTSDSSLVFLCGLSTTSTFADLKRCNVDVTPIRMMGYGTVVNVTDSLTYVFRSWDRGLFDDDKPVWVDISHSHVP